MFARSYDPEEDYPLELAPTAQAVEQSRRILALAENWDGEGASSYAKETWERVRALVLASAAQLWHKTGELAPPPAISPAQDGSIDVLWRRGERMLLVNVPADTGAPASYYGERAADDTVNGYVPTSGENYWLLLWLIR